MKKAKITEEGDFSQPSSKRHSFTEVFLVWLIINLIWGERQDFEINKPAKRWKTVSRQNGHLINHCIPETIKLELYYLEELSIYRIIVQQKIIILTFSSRSKNVREMLGRKNIQPPSCLRCTVLRNERLSSQGRQRGYNKLTFIVEMLRYLKEHVCGT